MENLLHTPDAEGSPDQESHYPSHEEVEISEVPHTPESKENTDQQFLSSLAEKINMPNATALFVAAALMMSPQKAEAGGFKDLLGGILERVPIREENKRRLTEKAGEVDGAASKTAGKIGNHAKELPENVALTALCQSAGEISSHKLTKCVEDLKKIRQRN